MKEGETGEKPSGRGCWTILLLLFPGFSLLVGFGLLSIPLKEYRVHSWPTTECTIVSSKVVKDRYDSRKGWSYSLSVEYTYEALGQLQRSHGVRSDYSSSPTYADASQIQVKYPVGAKAVCRFNPKNPGEAYLESPGPWPLLGRLGPVIGFVLCLGAIGLSLIWRTWTRTDIDISGPAPDTSAFARLRWAFGGLLGCSWLFGFFFLALSLAVLLGSDWQTMPPPRRWAIEILLFVPVTVAGWVILQTMWAAVSGRRKPPRVVTVAAMALFCLTWNVVTGLFAWDAVQTWRIGQPSYVETVVVIPFVVIGIAILFPTLNRIVKLLRGEALPGGDDRLS